MEKLIQLAKTRPGADCGSDHELLPPKLRIKLKRLGQTTRILRVLMCTQSLQSCPTLFDTVEYSFPSSSIHGSLQAGILEWVSMLSSRGSSQPRDQTHISNGSCIAGRFFTAEPPRKFRLYRYDLNQILSLESQRTVPRNIETTMQLCLFHMLAR